LSLIECDILLETSKEEDTLAKMMITDEAGHHIEIARLYEAENIRDFVLQ
jgi:hypothetical protein